MDFLECSGMGLGRATDRHPNQDCPEFAVFTLLRLERTSNERRQIDAQIGAILNEHHHLLLH